MFLIPEGTGARVVMAYEESKGLGKGPGGHEEESEETGDTDNTNEPAEREDWGKNILFHSFTFDEPETIAPGTVVNLPELDADGQPVVTEDGRSFLTANARRVRMIVQPESNWGPSQLAMALVYREGHDGHGHPAHLIMRRFIGGYEPDNMECQISKKVPATLEKFCVHGATNVTADHIPVNETDMADARAHRGVLRGDFLVVGYTYTDKWGGGDSPEHRYDFYIRRSFDGGKKWTNAGGKFEGPINISNLKEEGNPGWSVLEPRIFATPGTLKSPMSIDDVQNTAVYYVAYSTTHTLTNNPKDLYWTMTDNFGETYKTQWNDVSKKFEYPWFAKTDPNTLGGFAASQIRTNPAGTQLYVSYQADVQGSYVGGGPCTGHGFSGSDVCSNSTSAHDPLLSRFDLNGDTVVDDLDKAVLETYAGLPSPPEEYDINGDGIIDGEDIKIWRMGEAEYFKRAKFTGIRRHRRAHGYLRACA